MTRPSFRSRVAAWLRDLLDLDAVAKEEFRATRRQLHGLCNIQSLRTLEREAEMAYHRYPSETNCRHLTAIREERLALELSYGRQIGGGS